MNKFSTLAGHATTTVSDGAVKNSQIAMRYTLVRIKSTTAKLGHGKNGVKIYLIFNCFGVKQFETVRKHLLTVYGSLITNLQAQS